MATAVKAGPGQIQELLLGLPLGSGTQALGPSSIAFSALSRELLGNRRNWDCSWHLSGVLALQTVA